MTSYFIEITSEAREDLEDIYCYLAFVLEIPRTAEQVQKKIIQSFEQLQEFPRKYPRVIPEPERSQGIRMLPVETYTILYRVEETTVFIKNIVPSSSQYIAKLRGNQ